jgi:hypothetical protein
MNSLAETYDLDPGARPSRSPQSVSRRLLSEGMFSAGGRKWRARRPRSLKEAYRPGWTFTADKLLRIISNTDV